MSAKKNDFIPDEPAIIEAAPISDAAALAFEAVEANAFAEATTDVDAIAAAAFAKS